MKGFQQLGATMSSLRVVGVGLGRTGTHSLKLALEQLLDAPCYHMFEVFDHPEHIEAWKAAANGDLPDWNDLLGGYQATVDWPAAAFWADLIEAYPDAVVLHSVRPTAAWWNSASRTIFELIRNFESSVHKAPPRHPIVAAQREMASVLLRAKFSQDFDDERAACEAYERHNEAVRRLVPAERLVEWTPGDDWGPICAALGLPIPEDTFPHTNTTEEFRAMTKLSLGA